MDRNEILNILKEVEAVLEGHFLLSSGKHSGGYCQCAKLLRFPDKAAAVLETVAEQVGYRSLSGFFVAFRSRYGTGASEYRRKFAEAFETETSFL